MSDSEYKRRVNQAKQRWINMSEEERNHMWSMSQEAIRKASKEGSKLEKFLVNELTKEGFKIESHKKTFWNLSARSGYLC